MAEITNSTPSTPPMLLEAKVAVVRVLSARAMAMISGMEEAMNGLERRFERSRRW